MDWTISSGKFGNAFAYFMVSIYYQMVLLSNMNFYFDCKARLCLIVPGRLEKIYFEQASLYLQGIQDDINEKNTSVVDCKHKHMMKSRAPPEKFGVLYHMFTYSISWFHNQH